MKFQSFLPWDSQTLATYLAWGQGIGAGLSAMGWTKTSDTGQVVWANVTTVPLQPPTASGWNGVSAWSAGTSYTGVGAGSVGTFSVVTDSGLTYACVLNTSQTVTVTALQNAAATLTITQVAASSGQSAVYTVSSGVTASMIGQQFVVTAGGSNLNGNNAGTFLCTNTSGTTSITLGNSIATAQASVTGGSPGAQAISSTSVISFINTSNSTIVGVTSSNLLVGHTLVLSGWTGGSTGNNTTYTVTANAQNVSNQGMFAATFTGTSATQANITIAETTHPASDLLHWVGYNYELWQATDALASTCPVIVRFVYYKTSNSSTGASFNYIIGTGTTGTGYINGNVFGAALNTETVVTLGIAGGGTTTFECDFCASVSGGSLAIILWRTGQSVNAQVPAVFIIDRAHDSQGNEIDSYVTCMALHVNAALAQILFKASTNSTFPATAANSWPAMQWSPTNLAYNGQTPILPIFPFVGYMADPVLNAVAMKAGDSIEGQIVSAYMYGAQHNFMITKPFGASTAVGSGACIGVRYE